MSIFHQIIPDVQTAALSIRKLMIVHVRLSPARRLRSTPTGCWLPVTGFPLKMQCQLATRQLYLCTGGFGASPNSIGSGCFCTNLFTGKHSRFERSDILATLEADAVPKWAQEKLCKALQSQQKKEKVKEETR